MTDEPRDEEAVAELARAEIRDSIERAHELLCEAKLAMRQQETPLVEPPKPAS